MRNQFIAIIILLVVLVGCSSATDESASTVVESVESTDTTQAATTTAAESTSTVPAQAEPIEIIVDGFARTIFMDDVNIWLAGEDLHRVDRATGELVETFDVADDVAWFDVVPDHESVAVVAVTYDGEGTNKVRVLDSDGTQIQSIPVEALSPWEVAVDGDNVWIAAGDTGSPFTVAAVDGSEVRSIDGLELPLSTQFVGQSAWVLGHEHAELVEYDKTTLERKREVTLDEFPRRWPITLDQGAGYLWAGPTSDPAVVYRFDPAGGTIAPFFFEAEGARDLAFGDGYLWIAATQEGKILKMDPQTGLILDEIEIEGVPLRVLVDDGLMVVVAVEETDAVKSVVHLIDYE